MTGELSEVPQTIRCTESLPQKDASKISFTRCLEMVDQKPSLQRDLERGRLYTEIHFVNDETFILPVPYPSELHWASTYGEHSFIDTFRLFHHQDKIDRIFEDRSLSDKFSVGTIIGKGNLGMVEDEKHQKVLKLKIPYIKSLSSLKKIAECSSKLGIGEIEYEDKSIKPSELVVQDEVYCLPGFSQPEVRLNLGSDNNFYFSGIVEKLDISTTDNLESLKQKKYPKINTTYINGIHSELNQGGLDKDIKLKFDGHEYSLSIQNSINLGTKNISLNISISELGDSLELRNLLIQTCLESICSDWKKGVPGYITDVVKNWPGTQEELVHKLKRFYPQFDNDSKIETYDGVSLIESSIDSRLDMGEYTFTVAIEDRQNGNVEYTSMSLVDYFFNLDKGKREDQIPYWRRSFYSFGPNHQILDLNERYFVSRNKRKYEQNKLRDEITLFLNQRNARSESQKSNTQILREFIDTYNRLG